VLAILVLVASTAAASATGTEKVTICHAAGLADTTQYVTLTLAYPAVYGPAGHFEENGTARAGHEEDYLGPCVTDPDPSTEPTPSPSPSDLTEGGSPTPSPTLVASATPVPTISASAPVPNAVPNTAMTGDWTSPELMLVIGIFVLGFSALAVIVGFVERRR